MYQTKMHKANTERATNRNNHTWIIYQIKNLESLNNIMNFI